MRVVNAAAGRIVCAAALAVIGAGASGCAVHQHRLTDAFVRGRSTSADDGVSEWPTAPAAPDKAAGPSKPAVPPKPVARKPDKLPTPPAMPPLPTLESSDPDLAAALLRLKFGETAGAHRAAAAAYLRHRVTDMAERHLERAVQLDRCDAAAWDGLARIWRDWGVLTAALGHGYRARACDPDSPEIVNTIGTIMLAAGQFANARAAFSEVVRLDPGAAYGWTNLCDVALEEGKPGIAARWCRRALDVEPGFRIAQTNLALAYALDGRAADAERWMLKSPDPSVGYFNVGVLRLGRGQFGGAVDAFERAAAARPLFRLAVQRAAEARRRAGEARGDVNDGDSR